MPGIYVANQSGSYVSVKDMYMANSTGAWTKIKSAYQADSAGTWRKVYPSFVASTVEPTGSLYYVGGGITTYPPGHCAGGSGLAFKVRFNGTNIQVYFSSRGTWTNMTTTINANGYAVSSGQVTSAVTYGYCWRDEGEYFYVANVTVTATTITGVANGWDAIHGWRWGDSAFTFNV